jgi:glucokinase
VSDDRRFLGIDVGGTKVLATVVTGDGDVVARFKQPTERDRHELAPQIIAAIDGALIEAEHDTGIHGIGIAVPGVVDSEANTIVHTPNITVSDADAAAKVGHHYGLPVALGNDVTLGTFAECWMGAGRGVQTAVGIFVGTGIGGGVVIDGRARSGPEDMAGELGHMVLMIDGPECGCGNKGCFEAFASRTALERKIRRQLDDGRESQILEFATGDRIKSGALAAALEAGDELVTEVMIDEAHYLAQGVLTIRHLLNPDMIIFGGGVMEACGGFLLPRIEAEVQADCLRASQQAMRIVLSELGDDAVALGAAALIRAEVGGHGLGHVDAADEPTGDPDAIPTPVIESVEFGAVVVDGQAMEHDIYIRADGQVRKRKKKHARKKYNTSHVLDRKEMGKLCKGDPRTVFIGCGFQGLVTLTDDAKAYLDELDIKWECMRTRRAAEAYNAADRPKAVLLHVTC